MPLSKFHDAHFDAIVLAPFGAVGIRTEGKAIAGVAFLPPPTKARSPTNLLAAEAAKQVTQYLADSHFRFALPLTEAGTPFQRKVWQQIAAIESGKTNTYGGIAKRIRTAPRAVGQACGANPYPLVTPCHRVVSASGGLGGFSGSVADKNFLLQVKRWLLAHEGIEDFA
ncbi:MAG: methylated-DNA--[protein]-cysteine S-methyltransferase [Oxalobacter sp.]|nr:MAG: methylated-DNA--[protein]-cysteine S-methyltransferase [Oxalobacter sp.]